ncbi:MAG: hypothetical protein K0R66_1674 [Gammaproteobacteria bacterium]|jgi:hypothetical protein|nr:hypothetical protein [Gammaproteobacteria bacterium]
MQSFESLENLSILELNTMLKHVRLGKEHLIKHLKIKQFNNFLKLASLNEKQKERIHSDKQEKVGNVIVILNAVITGILGAMLGLSGYLGFKLSSAPILIGTISFCALVSGWIGYVSYKITYKKARETAISKKLHLIELRLVKIINEKRQIEIGQLANKIVDVLCQLDNSLQNDEQRRQQFVQMLTSKEDMSKWDEILEVIVRQQLFSRASDKIEALIQEKIEKVLVAIKKLAEKLDSQHAALGEDDSASESDYSFADYVADRSVSYATYIKVLTTPGLETDKVVQKPVKWFKSNLVAILAGMGPVLAGSFGSMFVFLNGTPEILKSFGKHNIVNIFLAPHAKLIGLIMAIALISYYGYSYIYSNYKNFSRQKEVEKTEKNIAEENAVLLKISVRHSVLAQILTYMNELIFIDNLLREFSSQSS